MTESRHYDLPRFNRIDIATGLQAILTRGDSQSVRIDTERPHLLDNIRLKVVDGALRAAHGGNLIDAIVSGGFFGPSRLCRHATMHICVPELIGIGASTGAHVEGVLSGEPLSIAVSTGARVSISNVTADTVQIAASTKGRVSIEGACEHLKVKASTGGRISAIELASTNLHVELSSGGTVDANARARATGHVSSGAILTLGGRPQMDEIRVTSGGELTAF